MTTLRLMDKSSLAGDESRDMWGRVAISGKEGAQTLFLFKAAYCVQFSPTLPETINPTSMSPASSSSIYQTQV